MNHSKYQSHKQANRQDRLNQYTAEVHQVKVLREMGRTLREIASSFSPAKSLTWVRRRLAEVGME